MTNRRVRVESESDLIGLLDICLCVRGVRSPNTSHLSPKRRNEGRNPIAVRGGAASALWTTSTPAGWNSLPCLLFSTLSSSYITQKHKLPRRHMMMN